jgi:hypothetical protein
MLQVIVALLVFLLGVAGVEAQGSNVVIEIVEEGIYQAEITGRVATPNVTTGAINQVKDATLLRQTKDVPAEAGLTFGFRYRVTGSNQGDPVTLKMVTRFPPQGLRDPGRQTTHFVNEYKSERVVGETALRTYTFDYSWEVVTGDWTLEIWLGDQKLAERTFHVYSRLALALPVSPQP